MKKKTSLIKSSGHKLEVFSTARNQGSCVDFNWLWSTACKINQKVLKEDRVIRKHAIADFIMRSQLKLRRAQHNKKVPKESLRAD